MNKKLFAFITLITLDAGINCGLKHPNKNNNMKKPIKIGTIKPMENVTKVDTINHTPFFYNSNVQFGPQNKYMFIDSYDVSNRKITIDIYNIDNQKIIKTICEKTDDYFSPKLNKYDPYQFNLETARYQYSNDYQHYSTYRYNLKENSPKKITIQRSTRNDLLLSHDKKLITSCWYEKTVEIHDIKTGIIKSHNFGDNVDKFLVSPDKNHCTLSLENDGGFFHYNIENDIFDKLIDQTPSLSRFNDSSTMLLFFNKKNLTITLYDVKNHKIVAERK